VLTPTAPGFDLNSQTAPDTNQFLAQIRNELERKGIQIVQDGPHFLRLVPDSQKGRWITNAPLRGAELAVRTNQDVFPAGAINFPATDVEQVLQVYAELAHRTVLRRGVIPPYTVRLVTTCALNRAEVVYAIETVLALNGLKAVHDGDHFVQVTMFDMPLKLAAPLPLKGAPVFDPRRVPELANRAIRPSVPWDYEKARRLFYEFLHMPDPRAPFANRLLKFYADLTDKTTVPSPKFDRIFTPFTVSTPLTREELLYAIETTLALSNLSIVPVDSKSIRLGDISELFQNKP
jgi:hypothetical protein